MRKLENMGVAELGAREAKEVNGGLSFNDALNSIAVLLGLQEQRPAEPSNCVGI